MDSVLPFVIWLFCVGLAAIILAVFIRQNGLEWLHRKEGFQVNLPNIRITSCPVNTEKYINDEGDTNCCEGDIVNGKCHGHEVCSLSPKTTYGLKTCSEWLINEWTRRAALYCSQTMPYYYGDMHRIGQEGCSASQCSGNGTEPEDPAMKKCTIYKNQNDELSRVDSCTNVIAKDTMVCPQSDAVKTILVQGGSPPLPTLLQCTYTPKNHSSNDLPVNCYEPTRYELFMRAKGITTPINSSTDVQFCPASKAYYVDNTLSVANAKGLPAGSCPAPSAAVTSGSNTEYVMYGDDIKGEIPVTKILKGVRFGPTPVDIYLAQDANIVHALFIRPSEVGRNDSLKFNGNASSIQTVEEIVPKYGEYVNNNPDEFRPGTKRKDYKIKPAGRLAAPAPVAPVAPVAPASQSIEIPSAFKSLLGSMSGGQNIFGN